MIATYRFALFSFFSKKLIAQFTSLIPHSSGYAQIMDGLMSCVHDEGEQVLLLQEGSVRGALKDGVIWLPAGLADKLADTVPKEKVRLILSVSLHSNKKFI